MTEAANATIWTGLWGRIGGRKLESGKRAGEIETLVALAVPHLPPQGVALDLGAGPGIVSLAMADRAPHSRVLALDLSADMLERLRRNAERRGLSARVSTVRADAIATGLEPSSVHVVTSNVLLHELQDLGPLFSELLRVLVPEGHIVLRDFRPSVVSRTMVRVFHGASVVGALPADVLGDRARAAGFVDVEVQPDGWAHVLTGRKPGL